MGVFAERWVDEAGGDFGQRSHDEGAVRHARVGKREERGVDDLAVMEEQVYVEQAGRVGEGATVTDFAGDPVCLPQKLEWIERRPDSADGVQEGWLR